ncbi:hypothetical protein RSOLAG22IIIB_07169 [Rhizoctonia solani]|uniref:Carboxypeptidase n=1 Tax=Rhizoctonia solani TaxID=456999 RepID=A0A0K6FLP8_9AGAM|nr:hypothetical protein RSOLAG22IIIB_07169 [Rhizoctonia solani]
MRLLNFSLLLTAGVALAQVRHPARLIAEHGRPNRRAVGTTVVATAATTAATATTTATSPSSSASATISFSNPKAADFYVDGTTIPEVSFDAGPSWSGLMPISADPNETRKLFFWFWPTNNPKYTNDLVFWTNGGPGCSSFEGLLQENGPFTWPTGTAKPVRNQWSWTNLSHVLWVEQPVGTGFSQGVPNITNEDELAAQFAGFLTQFLEIFSELKGKNFYATGESYAGYYIPYIANYLYQNPGAVDLNLKGTWIADGVYTWDLVDLFIPAVAFAEKWQNVLGLNSTFMNYVRSVGTKCGYTGWMEKYVTYPPAGPLPLPAQAYQGTPDYGNVVDGCSIWPEIRAAALMVNPNFNVYHIFDLWPIPWDVLGFPTTFDNQQSPIYFNRTDVQDAIHAPRTNWAECSSIDVFVNGSDNSAPSMTTVMPNVIEKSERTVIIHGGLDYRILADGVRAGIQNMTWNGKQGFQTPIQNESFVIEGFGILGRAHQERNLTYVEVDLSGHMVPQFAPWAAYKTLNYLLGRQALNDSTGDSALYPSDYLLYGPY